MENSSFYKGDSAKNKMRIEQKRGQVTLFIILAIILVIGIIVLFTQSDFKFSPTSQKKLYVEKCIEELIQSSTKELALSAGTPLSAFNTMYMDENISIICYTEEYNRPCIVQQPFLKQTFENALTKKMKSEIENCYEAGVEELRASGYDVVSGRLNYSIEINPSLIQIKLKAPTSISNQDSTKKLENFEINMVSNLYDVLMVANSILQFETHYGDSETSSFGLYYPDLKIEKIRRDNNIKIYRITNAEGIKYQFASRSYAWPAGYGINA